MQAPCMAFTRHRCAWLLCRLDVSFLYRQLHTAALPSRRPSDKTVTMMCADWCALLVGWQCYSAWRQLSCSALATCTI